MAKCIEQFKSKMMNSVMDWEKEHDEDFKLTPSESTILVDAAWNVSDYLYELYKGSQGGKRYQLGRYLDVLNHAIDKINGTVMGSDYLKEHSKAKLQNLD